MKELKRSFIRQSCTFCRTKKIRCSGGLVCSACQARNLTCVYTSRAPDKRRSTAQLCGETPISAKNPGLPEPRVVVEPTLGDLLETRFQSQYYSYVPLLHGFEEDRSSAVQINYKVLFFGLTSTLLELLSTRIERPDDSNDACRGPYYYYLRGRFVKDDSQTMFDGIVLENNTSLPSGSDQTVS
ncbi:hypothetical protein BDW74DRAFT_144744 [Aspergillus multicolor]|uniref:Zn(II)2Cys6 transcription factor domain-containing protein n=1 Tax=Aspergillus multicolor TaxID=41759 RepID=UPI003CCD85E7